MKKKNIKDNEKKNLYTFLILSFVFCMCVCFIIPTILYGRNLLVFYFRSQSCIDFENYFYDSSASPVVMSDLLNYKFIFARCFIPFILIYFIFIIYWVKKNIKTYRRVIYPIIYLLFLFMIYYIYISFSRSWIVQEQIVLLAPSNNFILSNFLARRFLVPFNNYNVIFVILVKIGDIVDYKNSKSKNKKQISNLKFVVIAFCIFLLQTFIMQFNDFISIAC